MAAWHAVVSVPRIDGGNIGPATGRPAAEAVADAAKSDPAVSNVTGTWMMIPCVFNGPAEPDVLAVEMDVASSYPPVAVSKIWGIVASALGGIGGWDLARASISLRAAA